ncbi:CU044_2847 family protein [Streptomyces sp. Li-HN-5-11]|uniref:CU044_2847 family protein n=1 Tax=Streptomyces sp. Li-HN-5-11 TaxID=3075432 RepID=UPI0028A6CF43|nr:CU044_2847 family protein [Streptomyces sp. Li-HN-5-11]WNM34429.1 CU044_2847 family protein [Streptomyces sp. Li-HN-5-11]
MPNTVAFALSDGTVVLVAPPRAGSAPVGVGPRVQAAAQTLSQALRPVTSAAAEVIDEFRSLAHRPDEVEVTFGVVLDAKLGAAIAGAKAGAHLDVTLRWSGARPRSDAQGTRADDSGEGGDGDGPDSADGDDGSADSVS